MKHFLSGILPLLLILARTNSAGVGRAWRVQPYSKLDHWDHPSWPRLDSSAFEVRTVSGVGRLTPFNEPEHSNRPRRDDPNSLPKSEDFKKVDRPDYDEYDGLLTSDSLYSPDYMDDLRPIDRIFKTGVMMRVVKPREEESKDPIVEGTKTIPTRVRRDAENETKLEKIASAKTVREVRVSSPESWSSQPLSVEVRPRVSLDQMIQEDEEEPLSNLRTHHLPRADFVTTHHRRSYPDSRESRDMPVTRSYDEYDHPWYRNSVRERDYETPNYRRGYNYYYPDRYRMDRDFYSRAPNDPSYYYDRYREDDFDLYGRSRQPAPKPKRIIYYATLPEVVRKPVDMRNYPRPYDGYMRTPASRDGTYKRIPGNVDPSRYRYRNPYDSFDSYSKRSSYYDRPYTYPEEESRRKPAVKDSLRNNDGYDQGNDRKYGNQALVRGEGKLPWPVQIGTEVNVKDDGRIPGRKIFGENNGYERFQSAQLQKAPDATGSSELQNDN